MNEQELEERDYHPDTELRNAYARSQQEFSDDTDAINVLLSTGRYVVVAESTAYCCSTDAILGLRRDIMASFATLAEAKERCNQEIRCEEVDFVVYKPI